MKSRVEKPRIPKPPMVVVWATYRCARCQAERPEHDRRFIHTGEGLFCVCGGEVMRVGDGRS